MYLKEIIKHKKEEIKSLRLPDISRHKPVLDPVRFLCDKPFIAEIKKSSPSRGDINPEGGIIERARSYEQGGAGAVSVLTDAKYFKGSYDNMYDIAQAVRIPVLCKDFILSELQVENAYLHGADFILIIAAVLSAEDIGRLAGRARSYGMAVLYELHDFNEFEKIKSLDPELVGVNSRDLRSFKIDIHRAADTLSLLPAGFMKVAESGIETGGDVAALMRAGADAFLVGTALMTAEDPAGKLKEFYKVLQCS